MDALLDADVDVAAAVPVGVEVGGEDIIEGSAGSGTEDEEHDEDHHALTAMVIRCAGSVSASSATVLSVTKTECPVSEDSAEHADQEEVQARTQQRASRPMSIGANMMAIAQWKRRVRRTLNMSLGHAEPRLRYRWRSTPHAMLYDMDIPQLFTTLTDHYQPLGFLNTSSARSFYFEVVRPNLNIVRPPAVAPASRVARQTHG